MNQAGVQLRQHDLKRDALISLLQEIQEREGFLSREQMIEVGETLGLPISKVYGVATFYNQFRFFAPGKYHIQLCRGTACHVKGSLSVLETLQRAIKIEPNQTTPDGLFSLEVVACIGACGLAPVISINGEFHAGMNPEKIEKLIATLRKQEGK